MQNFIFIDQESSQYLGLNINIYSLREKDWFFAFCAYKNVSQLFCFIYIYNRARCLSLMVVIVIYVYI